MEEYQYYYIPTNTVKISANFVLYPPFSHYYFQYHMGVELPQETCFLQTIVILMQTFQKSLITGPLNLKAIE